MDVFYAPSTSGKHVLTPENVFDPVNSKFVQNELITLKDTRICFFPKTRGETTDQEKNIDCNKKNMAEMISCQHTFGFCGAIDVVQFIIMFHIGTTTSVTPTNEFFGYLNNCFNRPPAEAADIQRRHSHAVSCAS